MRHREEDEGVSDEATYTDEVFVVVSYEPDGPILTEVDTEEAPSVEAAVALGAQVSKRHAIVVVTKLREDPDGIIRSSVVRVFKREPE